MEAASENTQTKSQRGRPKRFNEEVMALSRYCAPEVKTTRQLANISYRQRALAILWEDSRFLWLCDQEQMKAGAAKAWRRGILSELGRIDDPHDLRTVAEQVCKLQPKTKIAIALIRRWRLGKGKKDGWLSLMVTLERTVNDYIGTHPGAPWDDVERALEGVLEEVREQKTAAKH